MLTVSSWLFFVFLVVFQEFFYLCWLLIQYQALCPFPCVSNLFSALKIGLCFEGDLGFMSSVFDKVFSLSFGLFYLVLC